MWQPGLLLGTRGWCWGQGPPGTTAVPLMVSARLQAGGGPTELAPGWAQGGQRRCWDPRGHSGQRGPGPARWQSCPVPALGCAHIRTRRRVWCSPVPRGHWRGLCLSPTVKQAPRSLPETHSRPWPRRRHHPRAQQVPAALPQDQDGCHRPRRGQQDPALCSTPLQVSPEPEGAREAEQCPQPQEGADLDADPCREMDRVTRHLVFQLPQTAHRHDHAPADGDDDVFGSSQYGSQRVENGYEWRTRLKSPSYFLDGGKDVWTPSPDRESRLEVVRSGSLYDLRAYRGERKPSRLYEDDEQEQYRLHPPNISPEKAKELEDKRREVIRGQVVRKSSTMAERWSSMDELSSINVGAGGQGEGKHKGPGTSSFGIYFDKSSSGRAATPIDPESIDREQINFAAARQQFLMLEKTSPGSVLSPGQHAMSPKPEAMTRISRQEWQSPETATKAERGYGEAGVPSQGRTDTSTYQVYHVSYRTPVKAEGYAQGRDDAGRLYHTGKTSSLTKALSRDDLDSGLGEMYTESSTGYISNGSVEAFNGLVDVRNSSSSPDKELKASNETPIEREIRRALEREENLWKERGIQRLTSSSELVEIQTKPLLSMHTSPVPGRKGKDKSRASFYVQREIEQETKREEDLKRQGRLLGLYDRGTQQELDERKKVFEQEETPPPKPAPARRAEERRSWVHEEQPSSHGSGPAEDTRAGRALSTYTVTLTRSQPRSVPAAGERGRGEPPVHDHASASAGRWAREDSQGGRLPGSTPSPAEAGVLRKEHFSFPFWKPRISFVDDMGTQSPLRREKGPDGEDGRDEQYTLRTWKPQTSALIEEEIRSDLQREEELQEQRRRRQLIEGSLGSNDGFSREGSHSRHSSAASGASGSYSVSGSPVPTPSSRQAGVLGLVSSFTPLRVAAPGPDSSDSLSPDSAHSSAFEERRRRTKEDGKYAGIEPVDKINTEVVESTRVGRHKSAMAQRWEAGLYVRDED
uniref:A-kinase anchor protein 2 C-terminal domain-containing protein n=1 Tax=Cairina moschata TaxID=8855 RepID=A0A8C3GH16_CAIMO